MFIYDNGKVCVLANTRCGHTSMFSHFDMEPYSFEADLSIFLNTESRRILVLRNPYDRINSALKLWSDHPNTKYDGNINQFLLDHAEPYLHKFPRSMPVEIIDFYRLTEYMVNTEISQTTNSNYSNPEDAINTIPNIVDRDALNKEYEKYIYFMTFCKQIEPEEWKYLTK